MLQGTMLDADFARRIEEVYGAAGRAWLAGLPSLIDELSEAWDAAARPPFPNLSHNYVAPAVGPGGEPCVLKLGVGTEEDDREPLALRAYGGRGAARLLRHDPTRHAMLLERVWPGDDLREMSDPQAVEVTAGVLRRLWVASVPEGLPSLGTWTRSLERTVAAPVPCRRISSTARRVYAANS